MKKVEDFKSAKDVNGYAFIKDGKFFGKVTSYRGASSCLVNLWINGLNCGQGSIHGHTYTVNLADGVANGCNYNLFNAALSKACSKFKEGKVFSDEELKKIDANGLEELCKIIGMTFHWIL